MSIPWHLSKTDIEAQCWKLRHYILHGFIGVMLGAIREATLALCKTAMRECKLRQIL